MKILKSYQQAFCQLPDSITAAEVEAERESTLSVTLQNGTHNGASSSDVTALFVRASGEKTGFTYTQNLDEDPIEVITRAYQNSFYSEAECPEQMNAGTDYGHNAPDKTNSVIEDAALPECADADDCDNLDIPNLWAAAEQLDAWFLEREPHLTVRRISVTDCVRGIGIANTRGCGREYASHIISLGLFLSDERYPGAIFNKEYTRKQLSDLVPELFEQDLRLWYELLQNEDAADFANGSYPCVVSGTVMCNILLTSWQMFTARSYIGRNTPFAGKKDQQIISPLVSLYDRVTTPESGFQFPLDCEGSTGRDVAVVENGTLKHLLNNLTTAEALHEEPTGNAGRKALLSGNIHTDTIVTPKNFRMEPGSDTLETLLDKLGDGIYLYDSLDVFHSINIASGEYSIPCEGILIRDGQMAGKLSGLTINGKLQDLLAGITAVGKDQTTYCMPILNSYLVASPSVLVSELNVSR